MPKKCYAECMHKRRNGMKVADRLRTAVPCILVFGLIGALVGGPLGDTPNGIRAGVILGGCVAFIILQRKDARSS